MAGTSAPIVFFDIAGPDATVLRRFYASVFAWDIAADGRFTATLQPSLDGTIREDPAEKRIYVGVPDVSAKLQEIEVNGGTVDAPRFEVPGVVILGLFRDPAGNPMGLVETDGHGVRIP